MVSNRPDRRKVLLQVLVDAVKRHATRDGIHVSDPGFIRERGMNTTNDGITVLKRGRSPHQPFGYKYATGSALEAVVTKEAAAVRGTGGMLSVAEQYIKDFDAEAKEITA